MIDSSTLHEFGLEVVDIEGNAAFTARPARTHDVAQNFAGMQRIARAFVERPETILQELVSAAVELCGADSAGISMETEGGTDAEFYTWVATAGEYPAFLDAVLPKAPSACSVCLERSRPQQLRVTQPFFDILGVSAPLVTDGILLPWQVDGQRGTIFILAHGRTEAFDATDCRTMQLLADFAAMGIRQQAQQKLLLAQARISAAGAMANDLAHKINNPLQGLTNILYLAAEGHNGEAAREIGRSALEDLRRLSDLVSKLLALPYGTVPAEPVVDPLPELQPL